MKFNEFPEATSLVDDDILLVQEASTMALKKTKMSTLKTYIGASTSTSTPAPTPTNNPIPPIGHIKWYRADEVTLEGTKVISVKDKSTGNNLIPSRGIVTLSNNDINGKKSLRFVNACLQSGVENYFLKHIFIVYKRNDNTAFSEYAPLMSVRPSLYSQKAPGSNEHYFFGGNPNNVVNVIGTGSYTGLVFIDKQEKNYTAFNDYLTGIPQPTANNYHIFENINNANYGAKGLCIGADAYEETRFFPDTNIAEIIIYNIVLTETERSEIYTYFKQMYNFSYLQ